ncbi:MAG: hypothetical protein AAGF12_14845 [Myxococcota bacterium]
MATLSPAWLLLGLLLTAFLFNAPTSAEASSYASGKVQGATFELYASTDSVAMAGGESAWIADQERLIRQDLEGLAARVDALVALAETHYPTFRPVPYHDDLPECSLDEPPSDRGCYWQLRFDPLIERRSARNDVRVRLAAAAPAMMHRPFQEQLEVLGNDGTPSFDVYPTLEDASNGSQPPAWSSFLKPWPWLGVAALAALGAFAVFRARNKRA